MLSWNDVIDLDFEIGSGVQEKNWIQTTWGEKTNALKERAW